LGPSLTTTSKGTPAKYDLAAQKYRRLPKGARDALTRQKGGKGNRESAIVDRLLSRFDRLPARPRKGADRVLVDRGGPIHFPDGGLPACCVLEKDVGIAVAVEVARADRFPIRPRIETDRVLVDRGSPIHFPDRDLPVGVLTPVVEVALKVEVNSEEICQVA
jgi:hypothetical protein